MKNKTNTFLSSLFTSMILAGGISHAEESEPVKLKHSNEPGEKLCQNNTCKGHSECMGYGNSACGGGNTCKGQGWVSAKTESECLEKKGIWHGKKAKSNTPTTSKQSKKS